MDLAEAIAPECKIEIIGIRPGEKVHEELITANDAINTIEFDDYYVIVPYKKSWDNKEFIRTSNSKSQGKFCEYEFSYNSGKNERYLTVEELRYLINNHI